MYQLLEKNNRTEAIYWIKKLEKEELLKSERDFMMKFLSKLAEDQNENLLVWWFTT